MQKPPEKTNIAIKDGKLILSNIDELMRFATAITSSELCPKQFKGKPNDALIAIEWGYELGMTPMSALQSIAVINGNPSLYGDMLPGLVQSSGKMEYYKEEFIGTEYDDDFGCRVTSKRKDNPHEIVTTFTVGDAKKAHLWEKKSKDGFPSTWITYPKRMLKYRARAFNFRDNFADVLKGIKTVEEVQDYIVTDYEEAVTLTDKLDNKIKELEEPKETLNDIIPATEKQKVELPPDEQQKELGF